APASYVSLHDALPICQSPVLREGQGGEGRARALRRQRPQAERPGRPGEADLILGGRPYPQGGVRRRKGLDRRGGVPRQGSGSCAQDGSDTLTEWATLASNSSWRTPNSKWSAQRPLIFK